jgi:TatD DNase family protein
MIIDTHIHLDDKGYSDDLDAILQRAKDNGVQKFIIPGASLKDLKRAVKISQQYENIYFGVGVHPYDAHTYDRQYLLKYITHPKCVAVGECGLDYYRLPKEKDKIQQYKQLQKDIFIDQIKLAKEYKKPLIIHIRDASKDSKDILLSNDAKEVGGVLHCFNADNELLSLSDSGFYYGIGGVLTFKNAKKLVQILPSIPQEKLLIETDGPYLTPHPHRGERNEPAYTIFVVDKMAQLLNKSQDEIKTLTTKNAIKLFGI